MRRIPLGRLATVEEVAAARPVRRLAGGGSDHRLQPPRRRRVDGAVSERLTTGQALVRWLAGAVVRARRRAPARDPRHVRHLRPRQRARPRPGARAGGRRAAAVPAEERAGDGAHGARASRRPPRRLPTLACTASIGPGATNMLTGAATATVNRLPGAAAPGRHVRDAPVRASCSSSSSTRSRATCRSTTRSGRSAGYFDRVARPEQLLTALPAGDARAARPGGGRAR